MRKFAVMIGLALGCGESFGWAQSLLKEGLDGPYDTPRQTRNIRKHDHVKILVTERSRGLSRSELKTDKRSRWETQFRDFIRFDASQQMLLPELKAADLDPDPVIDIDARYRQDHEGRTLREFDLTFTVMAQVVDVKQNGTATIEARRERTINDEQEVIKLTGEVAPSFIVGDTVRSENIADLRITYEGTGSVSDAVSPGIIARVLQYIWPF
jgi:flagellar basal body L-ring protein FlgH